MKGDDFGKGVRKSSLFYFILYIFCFFGVRVDIVVKVMYNIVNYVTSGGKAWRTH